MGGAVVQWVKRWTCDQQVVGSNPTRGKSYVTTLGKLFTPMCFCHQAVQLGIGMAAYRRVDDLVTRGQTACTPGSAPGPMLGNKYGKPLLFYLSRCAKYCDHCVCMSVCVCPVTYLKKHVYKFHEIPCTSYLWLWLGPHVMIMRFWFWGQHHVFS